MALISQPSAPAVALGVSVAQRAKNALRRLALEKLEPTPENYAMAYRIESGGARQPAVPVEALALCQRLAARTMGEDAEVRAANFCKALADGQWDRAAALLGDAQADGRQLATLIDRLVRGVERGGRQWTLARKKESLQRVLDSSRSDARRMQQRLGQLMSRWESDAADDAVETLGADDGSMRGDGAHAPVPTGAVPALALPASGGATSAARASTVATAADAGPDARRHRMLDELIGALAEALPPSDAAARELAAQLGELRLRIQARGAGAEQVEELAAHCGRARGLLQHRHHVVQQLGVLCQELTASLTELAEDESWAKGQCDAMRIALEDGLTARGVKSVTEMLRNTRQRQSEMREERNRARDALKTLISDMLGELAELGMQTGRFHDNVGRYADVIEQSESLEALTGVVRDMVEESKAVQTTVSQTQRRLSEEHSKASDLTQRVSALESELHRLSGEVSTDQLTQIANRRGLLREFEAECLRMQREGGCLAVGLLDIDNFKRLNDELGHNAGDVALRSLASAVKKTLRPTDTVARYGGEEFVVLLPDAAVEDAQQVLTRLQRTLSGGLFLHEQKNVMVTFSAGVTAYRDGERIEDTLERADRALYEAKREGKNRTCVS